MFYLIGAVAWLYMRLLVFPSCVIRAVYDCLPLREDSWWIIRQEHVFLIVLLSILFFMHIFWFYFLIKAGVDMAVGKSKGLSNCMDVKPEKTEKVKE